MVALTDYAKKDRQKLEALRQSQILKVGGLLTVADFVENDEADIEDLFHAELFCKIVNGAFELVADSALNPEKLHLANEATERQVKKAESFFNTLSDNVPIFDHFSPASWLITNQSVLSGNDEATVSTLERAERIFLEINKLKRKT